MPTGDPITIPGGAFITLTQTLGGSFTVVVNGNMARIAGADADAIGLRVEPLTFADSDTPNVVNEAHVWHALRSVYDPEIPVNIADLGLIYAIRVEDDKVDIDMTLTAPGCGMGPAIADDAKGRLEKVPGVKEAEVKIVWDPPWNQDMITEEGKMVLGLI